MRSRPGWQGRNAEVAALRAAAQAVYHKSKFHSYLRLGLPP
jgi:hypothetical protein